MTFSLSTNWFASRSTPGAAIVQTVQELGFDALELGYRLTDAQGAEILRCIEDGTASAPSLHAYCPEPMGVPSGHPELYLIASTDPDERAMASAFLRRSLDFAKRTHARAIVLHTGRIKRPWVYSNTLIGMAERLSEVSGARFSDPDEFDEEDQARAPAHPRGTADPFATPGYRWRARVNAWRRRRGIAAHLDALRRQLDAILPEFEKAGVALCMENLPSWEAIPSEAEAAQLIADYNTPHLRFWNDLGHMQVRANMHWLDDPVGTSLRMLPLTAGCHIHDVQHLAHDHCAPGKGSVDFASLAPFGAADIIRVFEPAPGTPMHEVRDGLALLRRLWAPGNQPLSKA